MTNGNGDKFSRWMSNGLAATIAWGVVLVIYVTFRAFKIEDPLLGQAFLLLTGAWVGSLTLAQGRKTAEAEQKATEAKEDAAAAREKAATAEKKAATAEQKVEELEQAVTPDKAGETHE